MSLLLVTDGQGDGLTFAPFLARDDLVTAELHGRAVRGQLNRNDGSPAGPDERLHLGIQQILNIVRLEDTIFFKFRYLGKLKTERNLPEIGGDS